LCEVLFFFFFSSRRRHTRFDCDWSSDVCSSDLMDQQSYDQFVLRADALGETAPWLTENMVLTAVLYNGHAVGVTLPSFIEAEVDVGGGGSRGATASGKNLKDATLTDGRTLKVPLFIESGERVLVDARTWEFSRRAPRA